MKVDDMLSTKYDYLIIGGGFYGTYIAAYLAESGAKVALCEKEDDLLKRASYANQARVHNGYHYPRSILTALRSRISYPRFKDEFKECIDDRFEKYYLISKKLGKVTASQFEAFCRRIGAPYEPAPSSIVKLTDSNMIEAVYSTEECAFDAIKLKDRMKNRIDEAKVKVKLNTTVQQILKIEDGIEVSVRNYDKTIEKIKVKQIFNCSYSMINSVNVMSDISQIPLKHELTEMCLVKVPEVLRDKGFTVMCGPFFSVMPFPSTEYHSFSHVRYTPHYEWFDKQGSEYFDGHRHIRLSKPKSAWKKMKSDGARYVPILDECEFVSSIWEVKTILPLSEASDSRPILYKKNHEIPGYHCIMGGKIDNIYDVIDTIKS